MPPVSKDEVIGELFEALETAKTLADKKVCVTTMSEKWEPTFPGIGAEFARLAGFAKMFQPPPPPQPADLPIPTSLPGFLDLKPIGAGGYGVVCSATQLPFNRRVAVKIRSATSSPTAEERFDREQKTLARLHHTNIVPVHLSGRHGPYQFFVMKLIEGATLADLVGALSDQTAPPTAISTLADHAAKTAASRSREKLPTSIPSALSQPPVVVPTAPPAAGGFPVPPLAVYFRSVAGVVAEAGDALAHAHAADVIHRDVKPSNIMVGPDGVCSIIDFGLAGLGESDADAGDIPPDGLTQGALGTKPYMAPEQFHRNPEKRSDVWGLGATLYELLTLRRAYPNGAFKDAKCTVPADPPPTPRAVCAVVPPDLEAICLKSLERDPEKRYATAADMAEDVRRWERGEATVALPRGPLTRVGMWARRNPGWASTLASVALFLVAVAAATIWGARAEAAESRASAANAKTEAAEEREKTAKEREQDRQREVLVRALQGQRLSRDSKAGWREKLIPTVRQAAAMRNDEPLRTQTIALLTGTDAVPRPSFPDIRGSSIAFDQKGRMLLGGALFDEREGLTNHPTRLWDNPLQKPQVSKQAEPGPVAFRKDGTALQLAVTPEDRNTLSLWDVGGQKLVRHLKVPDAKKKDPLPKAAPGPLMTLSSDGKFAAATMPTRLGLSATIVWETESGAVLLNEFLDSTAIAVGPADKDGKSFLAVGDKLGRVTTWSLPEGKKLSTLSVDYGAVTALGVGQDVRRHDRTVPVPALRNRLLAVGGGTGRVSVWELESSSVRSFCHGSAHAILALAFSPDGTTLASAGRQYPRLWDVATGRLLLELGYMDYVHAIAFTPDAKSVAFTGRNVFMDFPVGTQIWAIENGRCTQTLRGLVGLVQRAWWSADGKLVAGLSHDWRLGVWDRRTGQLLHIFEVPQSLHIDNAGVAFGPNNRLVYSAGRAAFHWDLETGEQLKKWDLPEGLSDQLIYAAADKLYLFRQEGKIATRGPYGHPKENPRVCVIRNLFGPMPTKPHTESAAFNWDVRLAAASAHESCFLVEGSELVGGKPARFIKAFDAATGNLLWANESKVPPHLGSGLNMDSTGEFVGVTPAPGRNAVLRVRTGKEVEESPTGYHALGTPGGFLLNSDWTLRRRGENKPLFQIAIDDGRDAVPFGSFDPSGTRVLWVTTDGAIRVCDLTAAQEQLAALGLNW